MHHNSFRKSLKCTIPHLTHQQSYGLFSFQCVRKYTLVFKLYKEIRATRLLPYIGVTSVDHGWVTPGLKSLKRSFNTFFPYQEAYTDVSLACGGRLFSAHKFVLSTCSDYFKEMFSRTPCKHPVVFMKDVTGEDMESLLDFMYKVCSS